MLRYKNNVACTLASSLGASDVTITLTPGDGAQLPVIASGTADTFLITITDKNGNKEIISICRRESGSDTLYVGTGTTHQSTGDVAGRAQESTSALSVTYTDDHTIGMYPTAAQFENAVGGACPVGCILPYLPGYFGDGSNGSFTFQMVGANTAAAVNTYLNQSGWYVCNGAALNLASSPIFNGANRYLPNLTDDRFLMGDTECGNIGGSSTHTHTTGDFTLLAAHMPSHSHTITVNSGGAHTHHLTTYRDSSGPNDGLFYFTSNSYAHDYTIPSAGAHTHTASASSVGGGSAHNHGNTGSTNNLPTYLSCFYIMKVQ